MSSKQRKGRGLSNVQQRNNRPQFGSSRYQPHGNNGYQQQYPSTYPYSTNVNESNNGISISNGQANGTGSVTMRKGVYANWPFLSVVGTQLGTVVQIQTRNGSIWEGIFRTFSPDFDIVIEIAAKLDATKKFTVSNTVTEKMIFKVCDIVKIVSKNFDFNGAPLLSDSEIAKVNGQTNSATRELEPWVDPDRVNGVDTDVCLEDGTENGWEAEKMFKSNEEVYGIKNSFDESMPDYMPPIDCKNPEKLKRDEEFAAKLAMEMESNVNSHHNKLNIDNGDEEDMYAAVPRPVVNEQSGSGAATQDKYALPPRRSTQSSVTNRNNARGSVNGSTMVTTAPSTGTTQSKFDLRISNGTYNSNKNNKYLYNSTNSHYAQHSQYIGNDGHKTVPLRSSSYRHKSNYSPPLSGNKSTVLPPPPPPPVQSQLQTPAHTENAQVSPQRSEITSLDENKSSSVSASLSTSTSSSLATSPPQLKPSTSVLVNTSAQNQINESNLNSKTANIEKEPAKLSTAPIPCTVSVPKKSRDVQVTESKKFTNHEIVSSKPVENLKKENSIKASAQPTVPHTPQIPDILKSSNLNPNAKEFVLKPIVSNVPEQISMQQIIVPQTQITMINQQSSPPDLSRPQSPMTATVAPMMPIASTPVPHMIALQPHHVQGQQQPPVPFMISSMPHNLYFPQQHVYSTVMAQPQQNVANGTPHQYRRGGNKTHHIRDNNMAVVAATGQPLLAPPTHLASYIYPQAGGIQGPCITYRMFPQETSTIPYYNTATQLPPLQQQTPPNVMPPMQPLQYNTGNGGNGGGGVNNGGGNNVVSVQATGVPHVQQQSGPQMHHHQILSSATQGPPPQPHQQLYSFIPSQAGPIMPGTLQYITPGPGPGTAIQPGSQFQMLIQPSTPPMAGPGTGSVQ